ncbi:MAG: hypothetical protein R3D26_13105 [Cyanobacteriota/Melainabacteria group bacterium]
MDENDDSPGVSPWCLEHPFVSGYIERLSESAIDNIRESLQVLRNSKFLFGGKGDATTFDLSQSTTGRNT